jgi:hypothetical protein
MQPAYPTTGDMCTAARLKQFAARLPAYAAKYQIDEAEATALQGATAAFLDGLGEQIFRVTQAILLLAAGPGACWPPQQAAALSHRIIGHAAYDPADGHALGLASLLQQPGE